MYEIEMLGARDNIFANRSRETMIYGADVRHAHAHARARAHTNAHARGVQCVSSLGPRAAERTCSRSADYTYTQNPP